LSEAEVGFGIRLDFEIVPLPIACRATLVSRIRIRSRFLQELLDSSHVRVANGFGLELRHEQLWIEGFDRVFAFWVSLETLGRDHMSGEHLGSKIGMASSRVETRTFFWPVASVFRRIFFPA
jgi:hypothetical protein